MPLGQGEGKERIQTLSPLPSPPRGLQTEVQILGVLFTSWVGLGPDGLEPSGFISPVPLALTFGEGKACDLNKI